MGAPSLAERDRRWRSLDDAMAAVGIDALIVVGNDYRGHKGTLRYVADFDLGHRHGTAVKPRGGEAFLVLPGNLSTQRLDRRWVSDVRFPKRLSAGLVAAVKAMPWARTVGIVGRDQIMRVEDYEALREAFPRVAFPDASRLFEEVRVTKSAEELVGVEESAYILDRCFDRLLEISRPGITEREVGAEMYRVAHSLGGEDTLFLTMHTAAQGSGAAGVTWGAPRDRVLRPSDLFIFSFEVTGPAGYWTEFSRMVTFARPTEAMQRMASAVAEGISGAAGALGSGVHDPASVQDHVLDAAARHGVSSGYWSGHSIGLDVLEEPMIGAEVVEAAHDGPHDKPVPCGTGSVLALHPMLWDADTEVMGYMADTVVVEQGACRTLSTHPTQLFQLPGGAV
jgi:Xaa-Pro dipeptidase